MCYKNNEMNKKMALLDLDGFEIVELENIHKGDTIIYFRTKYFFNIGHHTINIYQCVLKVILNILNANTILEN